MAKANQILDEAGWKRGQDGVRVKDGQRMKLVFQTAINAPRQKNQAIIKQACEKCGIEMELKSVTASVFFSSDVANPDTYSHFYADMQMYQTTMSAPDPEEFMRQFVSWEIASKANKWQGRNVTRWKNEEYDATFKSSQNELDPVKRAALFIRMNDLVVGDPGVIPDVYRPRVDAVAKNLRVWLSGWDNDFWNLRNWFRET